MPSPNSSSGTHVSLSNGIPALTTKGKEMEAINEIKNLFTKGEY